LHLETSTALPPLPRITIPAWLHSNISAVLTRIHKHQIAVAGD
jgi:hypothetical protein